MKVPEIKITDIKGEKQEILKEQLDDIQVQRLKIHSMLRMLEQEDQEQEEASEVDIEKYDDEDDVLEQGNEISDAVQTNEAKQSQKTEESTNMTLEEEKDVLKNDVLNLIVLIPHLKTNIYKKFGIFLSNEKCVCVFKQQIENCRNITNSLLWNCQKFYLWIFTDYDV